MISFRRKKIMKKIWNIIFDHKIEINFHIGLQVEPNIFKWVFVAGFFEQSRKHTISHDHEFEWRWCVAHIEILWIHGNSRILHKNRFWRCGMCSVCITKRFRYFFFLLSLNEYDNTKTKDTRYHFYLFVTSTYELARALCSLQSYLIRVWVFQNVANRKKK